MTMMRILPGRQHPVSRALVRIRLRRFYAREQVRRESCRTCWGRRTIMSWRTAEHRPCPDCTPGVPGTDERTTGEKK